MVDSLIIGAGPAGLSVASTFAQAGLSHLVIEKGAIADHIRQYPIFMQFFSTRELLEIDRFPMTIIEEKPSRQQYLAYLARLVRERDLNVKTYTMVENLASLEQGGFAVGVRSMSGETETIEARSVVAACGAFENPRMLGVPGEDLPKVSHRFDEAHPYVGTKVLVVGGRNSAIEIALLLFRAGADVSLSYHREELDGFGIKYWLLPDIQNRMASGEVHAYLGTKVRRIDWHSVTLEDLDGREIQIENDFVLCMTGYDPPVGFLRSMGVEVEAETNIPRHDPHTLETNVPGLYVAGTIVAGNVSGHVFIENSREHGEMILKALRERLG
jgi:thioredoxin reductase (NADPH)